MSTKPEHLVFSGVALLAGLLAASLPDAPVGLNVVVVGWLVLVAVYLETRAHLTSYRLGLLGIAAALLAGFLLRSAEWLLAFNVIGALTFAVCAAMGVTTWRSVVAAGIGAFFQLPRGVVFVLRPLLRWTGGLSGKRAAVLRSAGIISLLVIVFGALFVSADAAFASLAERFLLPEIELGLLPARLTLGLVVVAIAGSLSLLPRRDLSASPWRLARSGDPLLLSPGEWISALVAIDLLFAAFVAVQIGVLFGGQTRVLETAGLTYAQYAREGFFQLVVVAFLTLGVVALVVRFGEVREGSRRWMQVLLGTLCVLTLVILASAGMRMSLYQEAYGFTRLRIVVDVTILWLGAVFALVIAAGAFWRADWLPRAVVALVAVALLGLNLYNPDARIAELNIDRFERTGKLDVGYLQDLSLDAVPALSGLPDEARSCVLASLEGRLGPESSLWSFNLARERARRSLEAEPVPLVRPPTC